MKVYTDYTEQEVQQADGSFVTVENIEYSVNVQEWLSDGSINPETGLPRNQSATVRKPISTEDYDWLIENGAEEVYVDFGAGEERKPKDRKPRTKPPRMLKKKKQATGDVQAKV